MTTPNDATGGTWTEIHEQLAYAYVRGWYDRCDGITNDSRKIEVAHDLAAKIPAVNSHDALIAERDQFKQVAADNLKTQIEYFNIIKDLRSQNAKLVEALRELLERVAPEGRYRSEEIEPYFKEPVAKARALLQSIENKTSGK